MTVVTAPEARMASALRRVTVVTLDELRGPADGILELPVEICWSLENREFDLADAAQVRRAYRFVIDAARRPEHLVPYLNAGLLKEHWQGLLPPPKRAAWESANPQLAARAAEPAVRPEAAAA